MLSYFWPLGFLFLNTLYTYAYAFLFLALGFLAIIECLIDNICFMFDRRVCEKTVDIPMDTICASLVADLFLYFYEAGFIQGLLKKNEMKAIPII